MKSTVFHDTEWSIVLRYPIGTDVNEPFSFHMLLGIFLAFQNGNFFVLGSGTFSYDTSLQSDRCALHAVGV